MAIPIGTQLGFHEITSPYDITRDSEQFLVMQRSEESVAAQKASPQINFALNWFTELKQRVPVK